VINIIYEQMERNLEILKKAIENENVIDVRNKIYFE
jgi:hypothetical protein